MPEIIARDHFQGSFPGIIAHRGGALLWPENSLLACRGAIALGVDQVQVDVRLSADGHAVVLHDATLDRTTEANGPVHLRRWRELSTVRLRNAAAETIPCLAAFVDVLNGSETSLRLELKPPPADAVQHDLPHRVVAMLRRAGQLDRTVITSFDRADLERTRALAATVPLVWLLDAPATLAWSDASLAAAQHLRIGTIGVRYDRLTQAVRRSCASAGLRLCCFGANDCQALGASIAAGADEISTDRPDLALRLRPSR